MSKQALLNVSQLAANKGAAELEFAVKKVHSLETSKGGPDGYVKAIEKRVEKIPRKPRIQILRLLGMKLKVNLD